MNYLFYLVLVFLILVLQQFVLYDYDDFLKIPKLNFKIVDASQIYAGLLSGEIDVTHHTLTAIPQEDYESIEALENVEVVYGSPITNQSVFIQICLCSFRFFGIKVFRKEMKR